MFINTKKIEMNKVLYSLDECRSFVSTLMLVGVLEDDIHIERIIEEDFIVYDVTYNITDRQNEKLKNVDTRALFIIPRKES